MRTKLFRKVIAGIATIAMAAQFAFVLPASAKTVSKSFDFEDGNKVFSDDSRITGAIEDDATLGSKVIGFTCAGNAQNGYSFAHYDFSGDVSGATEVKIELDYYNTNGGRAILSFGDAAVRGNTGQSTKTTYNKAGVAFNLGSDKSNGILMGGNVAIGDVTNKWMHVSVTMNVADSKLSYKITKKDDGSVIKEGTDVEFVSADASTVSQIDLFGYINSSHCAMFDNITIEAQISETTLYTVTYNVDGTESSENVFEGSNPTKVPTETAKTGYIFKGWTTDGNAEYDPDKASSYVTSAKIAETAVTANITYTAVYEKDAEYIEPMAGIEFNAFPSNNLLVAGADADTAASNLISVKVTGELGTDLSANLDSRVTDFDVKYELKGFRWIASKGEATTDQEGSNGYCDSYGELVVNDDKSADFQIKNHPFNYYGQIIATVTYNGATKTISRPLAYLGNTAKASANDILPRGGYISDFNKYSPDMVGYVGTDAGAITGDIKDAATDNWVTFGGNTRTISLLADEDGSKFMRVEATGTRSSSFATTTIDSVTDTQIIMDQMVRYYNGGSAILLKTANPVTWNDNATSVAITLNADGFAINNGEVFAPATTGVWYRVVISSDVTSKKYFAKVYSKDNQLIGESEIADFVNAGSTNPTYYMFRTPDNAAGKLDFNDVKIYRATIDPSSIETTTTSETLAIPEENQAAATATLTVSAKTTEGYDAIGKATWTVADDAEGITVTPSADDSHTATVSVDSKASAGTATINVSVGGATKSIDLTVTSSQDSIKFATPLINSVSIPMSDTNTVVDYAASVIDKDGNDIAGKTVTFALYDRNNANPVSPTGITLTDGRLTVTKDAQPGVVTVRATSTNSNNEPITNFVRVTIHGLAFDFGTGTDDAVVSGYTPVTPTTAYSARLGYGIEGTATADGTASIEDADADYLAGTFTFKVNVTPNKVYKVKMNYQGTAAFENISTDLSGVVRTNAAKNGQEYLTYVHDDGVLDITFSNYTYKENDQDKTTASQVSSIVIEAVPDKTAGAKPNIYTVGDSTIANNGSWAYVLNRDQGNYPELTALATFSNNGRGGKNLSSYYTGGELWDRVVTNVKPGDYVMIGDMGTNGMGDDFKGSFTYYIDACLAMGAKVILNSYSPHMYVSPYANCYDSATATFNGWRQDDYDNIVREIYAERKDEFEGFVEIGKNADESFTKYAADYAANGFASADAAAQTIIACAGSTPGKPDHNHYSNGTIAAKLMIEGYGGTKGIVAQLVDILSGGGENPPQPETYTVTFNNLESSIEKVWLGDKEAEVVITGSGATVNFCATFTDVEPGEYPVRIELSDFYDGEYEIDRITVNGKAVDKIVVTDADVTASIDTKQKVFPVEITVDEHVKNVLLGEFAGVKEDGKITFNVPSGTYYLAISCDDGYEVDTAPNENKIVVEKGTVTPENISITTKVRETPAYTVTGTVDAGIKSIRLIDTNDNSKSILGTIDGTTATFNNVEDGTYWIAYDFNDGYVDGPCTPSDGSITVNGADLTDAFEVTTTELPMFVLNKSQIDGTISIYASKAHSGGKAYIATYDDDGVCTVLDVLELPEALRAVETKAENIPDTARIFIWNNDMQPYDWAWENEILPELAQD